MLKYRLLIILIVLSAIMLTIAIPESVLAATEDFECTMDTYIREDEPTDTHDAGGLRVGVAGSDGTCRSILQFPIDWGTDIPTDATIIEATLTLDPTTSSGDAMTVLAQRLRRLNCEEDEATWEEYKSSSLWGIDGAASTSTDYTTTDQASAYFPGSGSEPMDWDVTDIVDRAQQYEEDVAFRVVAQSETAYKFITFGDHEGSSDPVLTIQWSYPADPTYPPIVTTGSYSDVTNTTAKLYGSITYVDNGLAMYEDFEWGIDTDPLSNSGGYVTWYISAPDSGKVEIDTSYHYAGSQSGMIYKDGGMTSAYFAHSPMPSSEKLSVRVRKDDDSRLLIYHGNGAKVINCGIYEDETIYWFDGTDNHFTGETVVVGGWNLFEITDVNWLAGTYKIYLNGWWICNANMRTSSGWNGYMYFYNQVGTASAVWIDNVGFKGYVAERGFQYGLTQTPTWAESETGLFSTGSYNLIIEDLSPDTEYWYRSFVTNEEGTAYGNWYAFTTVGPPTISTVDASNVASTSARLNSSLISDGGDDCTIKFGWGLSSESAIEDYDSYETLPGTYNTGAYPYLDVSELLPGYTYYFRVSADNGLNTIGDELTFETEATLSAPTNFVGYPESTSISLSWSKGAGSTNTLVRYGTSAYPGNITAGTYAYSGPSSTYTVEGLTAGTTYYFSAWGESGGDYSASYATLLMTTSGSAGDDAEDIDVPGQPSRWFNTDYTAMSGLGLIYDGYNSVLDLGHVPRATGWFLTAVGLAVLFGLLAYLKLGKKMLIGMIVLTVILAMEYFLKQVPWWLPLMTLILVIVWSMTHKQVQEG